jgi:hypothetical protein
MNRKKADQKDNIRVSIFQDNKNNFLENLQMNFTPLGTSYRY